MEVKVIASGSTGNCTYISAGNHKILIDCGISKKSIDNELEKMNVSTSQIDTLLITHEHDDHIRSLGAILRKVNLTCYMSEGTYKVITSGKNETLKKIVELKFQQGNLLLLKRISNSINYPDIYIDDLEVNVLPAFHDAVETIGFKINYQSKSIVYLTDTGYVHQSLLPIMADCDCYILEFNHDPHILMASDRTYALKMRILSEHGHLSNEDAAVVLAHSVGPKTKVVFYAHISQECNLTQIVEMTKDKVFNSIGIEYKEIDFVFTSPIATKVYKI